MHKSPFKLSGFISLLTFAACNEIPVTYTHAPASDLVIRMDLHSPTAIDMLWVIDNSGSMCQEQKALRDDFDEFAAGLARENIDFHVGVTTTDMSTDYPYEPVARPGHLQSTPQPVPGFDPSCHTAVDETGRPIPGDYRPIRDSIEAAVDCMAIPDESIRNPSNADIECAMYGTPEGCSITRAGCGDDSPACSAADLFPAPSTYRPIPTVLRSRDYETGEGIDLARLKADFACMSLVGTRGYGVEKGLAAAIAAVSPALTGGVVGASDANTEAPNHGLIRPNARFSLIFVTDENDCSHDGTLDENTRCGADACAFANAVEASGTTPLLDPADLKERFVAKLTASKGHAGLHEQDVFVVSTHGNPRRFEGDVPTEAECGAEDYAGISPSCATTLGVAYSGDRYERFLRAFPRGSYWPQPLAKRPEEPLVGWICSGELVPAFRSVGQFVAERATGCIGQAIANCDGDCDVEVRAVAPDSRSFDRLASSGYCIPDSFQTFGTEQSCRVDPQKFSVTECPDSRPGVKFRWADPPRAGTLLAGCELELRFP